MIEDASREIQEDIAALLSPVLEDDGFVLGGSAALREHGLIDRPTEDVDLFTLAARRKHFNRAVDTAVRTLEQHHYKVETLIGPELQPYARLHIERDGIGTDMDFAIMPRHYAPTQSKLGWIVALPDAVGSKAYVTAARAAPATSSTSSQSTTPTCSPTSRSTNGPCSTPHGTSRPISSTASRK